MHLYRVSEAQPPEASEFIKNLFEKNKGNLQFFEKFHEIWKIFYLKANFTKRFLECL